MIISLSTSDQNVFFVLQPLNESKRVDEEFPTPPDGTVRLKDQMINLFNDYLLQEHQGDILRLSTSSEPHRSVVVHFNCLCEFKSIFSELILTKPTETLSLLDQSLCKAIKSISPQSTHHEKLRASQNVHVRLTALPIIPEVHRNSIPSSEDVGKFIALRAIVSRVGPVQVLEGYAAYTCGKCGFSFQVWANFENYFCLKPPKLCPNRKASCFSTFIKRVSETTFCAKNYQELRVHEPFGSNSVGMLRRFICVCLEDDLLEIVKPGDDVVINGVVSRRAKNLREGATFDVSLCIKANYVENISELKLGSGLNHIASERVIEFENFWLRCSTFSSALHLRNQLVRSICPNVCGMYLVKLSLALMLVGAPEYVSVGQNNKGSDEVNIRTRGNPHILLIGDPGTAKSVLLRGATALCDRAVLTAATGTTAAGLTAAAIRDSSGWTLDAGALVLADGGLCAIDEFTALHGAHRAAVHEAMEQQTISLAKAGLMARLNCRCSVLAAANPPSNSGTNLTEDFGLPTPLLSRFDIIWRLVDPMDSVDWDTKISSFVLNLTDLSARLPKKRKIQGTRSSPTRKSVWPVEKLKEYFSWVKNRFNPQLSVAAANMLQRYYVWQRRRMMEFDSDCQTTLFGRRTLRLLESLVRLTKAHARLMARSEATVDDAIVVISLMDSSLQSTSYSGVDGGLFHSGSTMTTPESIVFTDIPDNPGLDYLQTQELVHKILDPIKLVENYSDPDLSFFESDSNVRDESPSPRPVLSPLPNKIHHHLMNRLQSPKPESNHVRIPKNSGLSSKPLLTSTQFPSTSEQHSNLSHLDNFKPEDRDLDSSPELDYSLKQVIHPSNNHSSTQTKLDDNPLVSNRVSNKLSHFLFNGHESKDHVIRQQEQQKPDDYLFSDVISIGWANENTFDVQLTNEDFEIDL